VQNAAHSAAGVRSVDHRCEVAAAAAALASFAAASVAAFAATVSSIRARSALPPLTVDEPASALTSAAAAASERWVRLRVPAAAAAALAGALDEQCQAERRAQGRTRAVAAQAAP
jgi:hypothetical protein